MASIVADTHAIIWYFQNSPKLSANANIAMDAATQIGSSIYISAITVVEIVYLTEKGKVPHLALTQLTDALSVNNSGIVIAPLNLSVAQSLQQISSAIVPDMPDRIIAATALSLALPLVTRDHKIQALSNIQIIW
jgi:PIN domain nuclease of toxin-antitoxin system